MMVASAKEVSGTEGLSERTLCCTRRSADDRSRVLTSTLPGSIDTRPSDGRSRERERHRVQQLRKKKVQGSFPLRRFHCTHCFYVPDGVPCWIKQESASAGSSFHKLSSSTFWKCLLLSPSFSGALAPASVPEFPLSLHQEALPSFRFLSIKNSCRLLLESLLSSRSRCTHKIRSTCPSLLLRLRIRPCQTLVDPAEYAPSAARGLLDPMAVNGGSDVEALRQVLMQKVQAAVVQSGRPVAADWSDLWEHTAAVDQLFDVRAIWHRQRTAEQTRELCFEWFQRLVSAEADDWHPGSPGLLQATVPHGLLWSRPLTDLFNFYGYVVLAGSARSVSVLRGQPSQLGSEVLPHERRRRRGQVSCGTMDLARCHDRSRKKPFDDNGARSSKST